ncbi:MAG: phage virion morphogenesis protein [Prevotellaceae bacterium]|jgi:phage gpG-like protein|nr:phage virion morphogenesis protein [Prevotellaceae bacterium]
MSKLDKIISNINNAMNALPQRIATLAVNFSKERFVKKDWHDTHSEPWAKTRKKKGSTLVASGRLKKSIRKIKITPTSVTIGTDVPYAEIHNEGGNISGTETVKSHTRKAHKVKGYKRKAFTFTTKNRTINVPSKRIKAHTVGESQVKSFTRRYNRHFKARRFIGKSAELERQVEELIKQELNKAITGQ